MPSISTSQLNAMGLLSTAQSAPQSNFYNSPYKPVTSNTSKQELYDILQAYASRRMNIDDIARDYGVSREEAINNLVKAGIPRDDLKNLGLLAPTITQIPIDKPIQLTEDMTEDQVRRMLQTYSTAGKSFSDVANMYGVDPDTAMLNLAKVGISPSMLTVHFRDVPFNNTAVVAEATKIANQVRASYDLPDAVVDKHIQLSNLKYTAKSVNDVLAATGTSNLNDAVNVLADYGIAPDFLYARNLITRDELVRQAPDVYKAALRAQKTLPDMRGALYGRRYVLPAGDNTLAGEAGHIYGTENGVYSGYLIDDVNGWNYVPGYGYVNPTGYPGGAPGPVSQLGNSSSTGGTRGTGGTVGTVGTGSTGSTGSTGGTGGTGGTSGTGSTGGTSGTGGSGNVSISTPDDWKKYLLFSFPQIPNIATYNPILRSVGQDLAAQGQPISNFWYNPTPQISEELANARNNAGIFSNLSVVNTALWTENLDPKLKASLLASEYGLKNDIKKAGISSDLSDKLIAIYEESLNKLNAIISDSNANETTKSEAVKKHVDIVKNLRETIQVLKDT